MSQFCEIHGIVRYWDDNAHYRAPAALEGLMTRLSRAAVPLAVLLLPLSASLAQPASTFRARIDGYRRAHDVEIVRELSDFLAIRNLASDSVNIRRNARHILDLLARRGIAGQLLESPAGGAPAVFGELKTPGATKTVVLYAHYDGQPVDTTQWITQPWSPVLRDKLHNEGGRVIDIPSTPGAVQGEWRLYARSAGDDKSPIIMMLRAVDALRASAIAPSINIKFFFEGEEEAGSGNLRALLEKHADLLRADAWLFGDGPVHQSRRQQVVFGVRGVSGLDVTVYGPSRGLHSGHYGNWAYNPITLLANFVASMRNDDGRILIPGFYDDVVPISAADRRALAAIPPADSALRLELSLGGTEANGAALAERIMEPALNLRGFRGGGVGAGGSNTISTEARASIDFRLVPNQTPRRIRSLVEGHARKAGYFVLDRDPTTAERLAHPKIMKLDWDSGYPASRVSMTAPASRAVLQSVEAALGNPVIALPTLGGSLPMYIFDEVLKVPLIGLPTVNHDNSQHASNENLRIQNLWDGIVVYAGIIADMGRRWTTITP